ncbi:MAG: hypothetical protein MK066_10915 [Crocinitomicaceae bacterium]|nr:hypothetical protein [Crocinitomicaceae bacterium]
MLNQLKLTALSCACGLGGLFAQQESIEGIKFSDFHGVREIENVGYYTFFEEENQRGKTRAYNVRFLNYDYSEKKNTLIELSKVATVSTSENNDSHLVIGFSDFKERTQKLKSFDQDGNIVGELEWTGKVIPGVQIFKAKDGFALVKIVRPKAMSSKANYEIVRVDNELNVLWERKLPGELVKGVVDLIADEEDRIGLVYSSGKGAGKEKYSQHFMKLDENGEVLFDEVFAQNYFYLPNKLLVDGDNMLIFGSYPKNGKSKAIGVFAIAYDNDGTQIAKNEVDYQSDISPMIRAAMSEEELNMKENPQFFINDVVKTENGYMVVTETLRMRPSIGASVHVSTGGSGGSLQANTTLIMGDFLVLKISEELNVNSIQVVNKKKNRVVVGGTIPNVSYALPIIKANNISNFQFIKQDENKNNQLVYTIRKNFLNGIQIGVADLDADDSVVKSMLVECDLEKMKAINAFDVMNNEEGKISVYVYRKKLLSFYDLTF